MSNLIQVKRSTTTRTPPALEFGEFAYTTNGDLLWMGQEAANTANVVAIGGKRNPGVLTANQAIVVDGNKMIDTVMLGNSTVNAVANSTSLKVSNSTSNSTFTIPTSAQWSGNFFLHANGSWATPAGVQGGSNTQLQFNDSGTAGASAGLTFDKSSNTLTVGNTLVVPIIGANVTHVGNSTVTAATFTGNSTVTETKISSSVANVQSATIALAGTTTTITSNVTVSDTVFAVTSNTQSLKANSTVTGLSVVGNSTATYVLVGNAASVANVNAANAFFNGTNLTVNANLTVSDTVVAVTANTQSYKANSTVTGLSVVGNSTATYVLVGDSASVVNVNSANAFFNGTNLTVNANLAVTDTTVTVTSNTQNFKSNSTVTGMSVVGNSTATVVTLGSGASVVNVVATNTFVSSTNTTVNSNVTVNGTSLTVAANATFNANVTISGDLIVNGSTTVINVDTISVEDSIIKVASNNSSTDTIDFGLYGVYGSTGAKYAGLFRDASNSGIFTLFTALTTEPTTTVDTSAITRGTLLANFTTEVFTANSTKVSITAGSLNTDLTVQDGGTGAGSFTQYGILYGNTTNPIAVTAAGTDGQVLQANSSGVPVWGGLDGGTF